MTPDNDNDPLTFVRLAALTANVTRFLFDKEQPPEDEAGKHQANQSKGEVAAPGSHSEHVEQPLLDRVRK